MKIWLNFNQVTKIYSISREFGYQLVSQVKLSPPLGGDKYPSMTELQTSVEKNNIQVSFVNQVVMTLSISFLGCSFIRL